MFYLADRTENLSSGHSISDSSEKLLQRDKGGANICRVFATNKIRITKKMQQVVFLHSPQQRMVDPFLSLLPDWKTCCNWWLYHKVAGDMKWRGGKKSGCETLASKTVEKPEFRESESFIQSSKPMAPSASQIDIISVSQEYKHTCILLQRKTLSLLIKAGKCIDILQKTVQNKRQSLCSRHAEIWDIHEELYPSRNVFLSLNSQ